LKTNFILINLLIGSLFFHQKTSDIHRIQNSLKEIQSAEGRLALTLVREWGGDNEVDENKFFFEPRDIAFNRNGQIHILESTRIKVFDDSGKYLKTLGSAGQGPGELLEAINLEIDSENNLLIFDADNRRIQILSPDGRVLGGFPLKTEQSSPMLVTQKKEILMCNRTMTKETSPLWQYFNYQGRLLRESGERKGSSSALENKYRYEFFVALDKSENIYGAAAYRPLIQKYSPAGEILEEITYEPSFEVPEIKAVRRPQGEFVDRETVCRGIDIDAQGRGFLLTLTRLRILEERKIGVYFMSSSSDGKSAYSGRLKAKVDPSRSDLFQILVFGPTGKIIASKRLDTYVNKIKIHKDRLFLIDSYINMKILEYKIPEIR
jgi:hypothetical protein